MALKSKKFPRSFARGYKVSKLVIFVVVFAIVGAAYLISSFAATLSGDGKASTSQRFAGDPNPKVTGKAYWGASIDGNGDPYARHEQVAGKSLSVRRTFWQWSDHASVSTGKLYKTVKADHAANRLPMISTKTPPWFDVAAGLHDARIDQLLRELNSYGKPVWLIFSHEPENDVANNPGGAAAWRAMQQKVRQRMTALGTKNIALMPNFMAYTWDSVSGRNPEDWWVPGAWNAVSVDLYNYTVDGGMFTGSSGTQWSNFVRWAENKGLPIAVSEWGNRGTNSVAGQEMADFWNWSFANRKDIVAYSYFDSGLNSPGGSWQLTGDPLIVFRYILTVDTRILRINELK